MKEQNRLRYDLTLSQEKRVETGSYYTPTKVAKLMTCLALAERIAPKTMLSEEVLFKAFHDSYPLDNTIRETVLKVFLELKILDLSAGSGVFPLTVLEILNRFQSHLPLEESSARENMIKMALQLHVMDIQEEPLKLYQTEIFDTYGIEPQMLPVYKLDALSEIPIVHSTLKSLCDEGFDLILGNPPYLGEKNHKELFQKLRSSPFGARYYEGRMDYFYYFIYRALECLKPEGLLCYITTNYFATADGAVQLRKTLYNQGEFKQLINFNDSPLFKDALGQHNAIYLYVKSAQNTLCQLYYPRHKHATWEQLVKAVSSGAPSEDWLHNEVVGTQLYDDHGMIKLIPSESHKAILHKITHKQTSAGPEKRPELGDVFHVQQGIVSGYDRDFKKSESVFVLTPEELSSKPELKPYAKGFIKNKQIRKFRALKPFHYHILYIGGKLEIMEKEEGPLFKHLSPYRVRLAARREVVKNIRPWYALQWPRESWRFEGPLIAAPQRAFVNVFAYEEGELYGSADIYYIAMKEKGEQRAEQTLFMTAYLNSPIIYFWLSLMGKRKGSMLELYASPLKRIPIEPFDETDVRHLEILNLSTKLTSVLSDYADTALPESVYQSLREGPLSALNNLFYEIFDLSQEESQHIEQYFVASGADLHESTYWGVE